MRRSRPLAATASAVLSGVLVLSACTGGGTSAQRGSASDPPSGTAAAQPSVEPTTTIEPAEPLGLEDLRRALLRPGHVDRRTFTGSVVEGAAFHTHFADPALDLGCLRRLDRFDFGVPFSTSVAATVEPRSRPDAPTASPSLLNLIGTASSTADVDRDLAGARRALRGCTEVRSLRDGVSLRATVRMDDRPALGFVDDQLNVQVSGRLRILRSSLPLTIRLSVARIQQQVVLLRLVELGGSAVRAQRQLTAVAVRRVLAALDRRALPAVRQVDLRG